MEDFDRRLSALHANASLLNRLKFFIHDLLQFRYDASARQRLLFDATASTMFYLSSVYFSPAEIGTLLSFKTCDGIALEQALQLVVGKKLERARDGETAGYEICTFHDLAPTFQDCLGIQKDFQVEKEYKRLYKNFIKEWKKRGKKTS
jgi:hypothetical protein